MSKNKMTNTAKFNCVFGIIKCHVYWTFEEKIKFYVLNNYYSLKTIYLDKIF